MDKTKLDRRINRLADKLMGKGAKLQDIAVAMIQYGTGIIRDEEGISSDSLIVTTGDAPSFQWPSKGHRCAIVPKAMMSPVRISEYLDYATVYGAYDENTPNGTTAENGAPMNDYGRAAIILLKKVLGILPPDYHASMPIYNVDVLVQAVTEARDQFQKYAELHDAKLTEDGNAKAAVNHEFVAKMSAALQNGPGNPPQVPQESDSGLSAPVGLPTLRGLSDAPLDRDEMLALLDEKIVGCQKNDMPEAFGVLTALRSEVAQHLEAAPIDFAVALRAFYVDCHARNVKAGWWSDLATGEPKKRSVGELFILFVTELVEAYDAYCAEDMDDKLPQHPGLGVELGDLQIRLADFCGALLADRIVSYEADRNPGDEMFREIREIAHDYEKIRKTPEALGDPETGDPIGVQDVAAMTIEKLAFNATRADHKPENRKKEGGKQT